MGCSRIDLLNAGRPETSSDELDGHAQQLVINHVRLHDPEQSNAPEEGLDDSGCPFAVLKGLHALVDPFNSKELGERVNGLVVDVSQSCPCLGIARRVQPELQI